MLTNNVTLRLDANQLNIPIYYDYLKSKCQNYSKIKLNDGYEIINLTIINRCMHQIWVVKVLKNNYKIRDDCGPNDLLEIDIC